MLTSIQHLNGNLLCSVDTETTGLRAGYHELIQLGVVPLDGDLKPCLEPKVVPPGYIQDPKQPQVFIQQKPECKHRKIRKCNCSNPVKLEVCDLERPLDCVECEEREI